MNIIITSPSLNPNENVSGISSVAQFIISNNGGQRYLHFEIGKKDKEMGGWHRIPALTRKYKEWKQMLAAHPDAIIHYNFPLSKASLLRDPWFMRYAWKRGRKMVVHVHGGLFLTAPHIPDYLMRIMRWVFGQNLPFIVLSDMEKDILQKRLGAKNVVSLPNCVELNDAQAFEIEGGAHNASVPLRIGYLGRIEPNKGMTELLAACQQLKKEGIAYKLVIAGKEQTEGEYLPLFEQQLGDNFEYAGLVSGKTKCDYLRSLDVFVLPSYSIGSVVSLCMRSSSSLLYLGSDTPRIIPVLKCRQP